MIYMFKRSLEETPAGGQGQRTIARAWDPQGPVCSKEEATAEATWVAVRQKAGKVGAGG